MAKIPAWVYIVIGLFVSLISWKLDYKKLIIFFYVGLVFIIMGIVKLIYNIKNPIQKIQTHAKVQFKRCRRCGNAMRLNDRFCRKCGERN